jgi:flagellar biosynthesis protein FlhG
VEPLGTIRKEFIRNGLTGDDMDELRSRLWAIGGGKGGVGKSIVSLILGSSLARKGKKVVLVDADLGGSNLHTLAGIRYPLYTLADFIARRVNSIEDVMINTPVGNLKLICGADDILGIANPKSTQKTRIFNNLKKLEADFILLDLGAGTSFTTIDFFLYAPNKIVVFTPQITSIQNAYGFIKSSLYRAINRSFSKDYECQELIRNACSAAGGEHIDSIDKLKAALRVRGEQFEAKLDECLADMKLNVIVNMVRETKEREVGQIVKTVAKNYLSLSLETLGIVQYDRILSKSINNMASFLAEGRDSTVSQDFYDISNSVIKMSRSWTPYTSPAVPPQPAREPESIDEPVNEPEMR